MHHFKPRFQFFFLGGRHPLRVAAVSTFGLVPWSKASVASAPPPPPPVAEPAHRWCWFSSEVSWAGCFSLECCCSQELLWLVEVRLWEVCAGWRGRKGLLWLGEVRLWVHYVYRMERQGGGVAAVGGQTVSVSAVCRTERQAAGMPAARLSGTGCCPPTAPIASTTPCRLWSSWPTASSNARKPWSVQPFLHSGPSTQSGLSLCTHPMHAAWGILCGGLNGILTSKTFVLQTGWGGVDALSTEWMAKLLTQQTFLLSEDSNAWVVVPIIW